MQIDVKISINISGPGSEILWARHQEGISMISSEIQKILDQARQSSSLVQSVHLGMQGLQQQVADMKAKINSMPAGNVLSDEDKAALQEAAGQLDNTINMLKSDIPANIGAQAGEASKPSGGQQTGAQSAQLAAAAPQPDQTQQPQGDQSTAQPLPGTGQS